MGGGQERSHRAGTENVAGIAAFGLAAQLAVESLPDFAKLSLLRDQIEKAVRCNFVRIQGATAQRVANTTLLTVRGQSSEVLLIGFDLEGVALSGGSACSSGATHSSHVLKAMGVPEEEAGGALRISFGWNSTQKDVDEFVRAWNNLRSRVMKDLDNAPASFRSA
jgi:cysteine desulfurase